MAYDPAEGGRDALSLGAWLARTTERPLVVGSVFRLRRGTLGATAAERRGRAVRAVAEGLAALAHTDLKTEGTAIGARSTARGLAALSRSVHAELIVLGSTRHGPVARAVPGATAERLVHLQRHPVAVAPAGFADRSPVRAPRLGVAFDGWEESRSALRLAVTLARQAGGTLVLLMAPSPGSLTSVAPAPVDVDTALLGHGEAAGQVLESTLTELPADVRAEAHVLSGRPEVALAEAVEGQQLDLFVAGSRRFGPLTGRLAGSISQALMHGCECPVIVVPRDSKQASGAPERGARFDRARRGAVAGAESIA